MKGCPFSPKKGLLSHSFGCVEDWPEMDDVPGSRLKFSIKMEMREEGKRLETSMSCCASSKLR